MEMELIAQNQQKDQYFAPIQIQPEMEIDTGKDQSTTNDINDLDYRSFLQPNRPDCKRKEIQPRRSTRIPTMSANALENLMHDMEN